jgi:hypothetical protein
MLGCLPNVRRLFLTCFVPHRGAVAESRVALLAAPRFAEVEAPTVSIED